MTRIVIVGEIYNADLSIGGGPIYPGAPGSPSHPWVPPPAYPAHPIQPVPPGYWGGVAPPHLDQGLPPGSPGSPSHPWVPPPPGYWGGVAPPYPDQGLPGPQPPAGGTEVPPEMYTPAPIPEEIASQYVVSVYDPKTTAWTTKSYPPR
jgi:hypothetical protein